MQNKFFVSSLALVVLIGLLLPGCRRRDADEDKIAVTDAPPMAAHKPDSLTEDECRAFGKKLENAIATGDKVTVLQFYRYHEVFDRSVSDLELSPSFRNTFLSGAKHTYSSQFMQQMFDLDQQGGKITFLRVRNENGSLQAILRIIFPDGGVNYHQMALVRHQDGTIVAKDVYFMLTGENVSETMRRTTLVVAAEKDRNLFAKLRGSDLLYSENRDKIQALSQAIKQGRHQDAFNAYKKLPAELQKDKTLHIVAISAAQKLNSEDFLTELEGFRRNNPGDPCLDLISIGYFRLKKQYDKALQCIARVDQAIGGDPYLSAIRGSIMLDAGRHADAKAATEKAVELEPTLEEAYWYRIFVSLSEKNHAESLDWLRKVVTQCNATVDVEDMKTNIAFASFAMSEQYQTFKTWYLTRKK